MLLEETIQLIRPADRSAMDAAWKHWDSIAKPLRSLGKLEELVVQIAGIQGTPNVKIDKKGLIIMCADNGVVEEGVTQTGQEVTAQVAENFLEARASAGVLCRKAGADIFPIDIGIYRDTNIRNMKIAYGTKNFAKEPAMTREEAIKAIEVGISLVKEKKEEGYQILATGEMGIGNTTTSSAMASVFLRKDPEVMTGRGAGLSSEGLKKKIQVIKDAICRYHLEDADPIDVLAKVGGFDIAGMTGVFLGGAAYGIPIVIDGFISSVAALTAVLINENVKDYMIASHVSQEPAAKMLLDAIGKEAALQCNMRLGEGTGAVTLFPVLEMGLEVYKKMFTFEENDIESYVPQN